MPNETQILPIDGQTSTLGWRGSQSKLRKWTATGRGELNSMQSEVNRLFRTRNESERQPPRISDIDDVTRGLGLDPVDETKLQDLITQTYVAFAVSEKDRRPKLTMARQRLSSSMRANKRINSDQRQEIMRRALVWWKVKGKSSYQGKPAVRYVFKKAMSTAVETPYKGKGKRTGTPGNYEYTYTDVPRYKLRVGGQDHAGLAQKIKGGIEKSADLCKINPPTCEGNLGIPRSKMPQLAPDVVQRFLKAYQDKGVKVSRESIAVGRLMATQGEINAEKVVGMAQAKKEGKFDPAKEPIIVSKDGYVLDGHHRWAAELVTDPGNEMRTYRVDIPIQQLLKDAGSFGGVQQEKFGEGVRKSLAEQAAMRWWNLRKAEGEAWEGDAQFPDAGEGKVKGDDEKKMSPKKKPPKKKAKGKDDLKVEGEDGEEGGDEQGMDIDPHEMGGYHVRLHDDVSADLRDDVSADHHIREWAKHTTGHEIHKEGDPKKAEAHRHAANLHARIANGMNGKNGAGQQNGPPNGNGFPKEASPGKDSLGNDLPAQPDKERNMPSRDTEVDASRAQQGQDPIKGGKPPPNGKPPTNDKPPFKKAMVHTLGPTDASWAEW